MNRNEDAVHHVDTVSLRRLCEESLAVDKPLIEVAPATVLALLNSRDFHKRLAAEGSILKPA